MDKPIDNIGQAQDLGVLRDHQIHTANACLGCPGTTIETAERQLIWDFVVVMSPPSTCLLCSITTVFDYHVSIQVSLIHCVS